MSGFSQEYWQQNYQDPKTIDGIGNVKDHSQYLKAYFNLEGFEVNSIIDLGFGLGYLMKELKRAFKPRHLTGIEPSPFAFKKMKCPGAQLLPMDLVTWASTPMKGKQIYDLAVLNSVLQYLSDKELRFVLPILAQRARYVYLTVPTDIEYQRQHKELDFKDSWARVRTRGHYQRLLRPHFTFVSCRIIESRHFYDDSTTPFQDLLFRF